MEIDGNGLRSRLKQQFIMYTIYLLYPKGGWGYADKNP
jgi:hypothetical protein